MFQEPRNPSCMELFSVCGRSKPKTAAAGQRNVNNGTPREVELLEDTLAAQMNSMSFQKRTKAMDDLHCVGEGLEENEEKRRRSLAEFGQIVKATKNRFYDLAASQSRGFVEDESFRLKFLRAQSHNAEKAVRQMMSFLYFKATYFGEDNVAREIELSDMSTEEVAHVRSGLYFVSKHRDRAGRLVLYVLNNRLSTCTMQSTIRANFFFFYKLIASLPEVQMKGISAVYYDRSKPGEGSVNPDFQANLRIMAALTSIPYRCSSLHLCIKPTYGNLILNNTVFRSILNLTLESTLVRTRLHIGSDMEIQYILQSHGISLETCPVDSSGEIRQEVLNSWYECHLKYMKSRGLCVNHLISESPATIAMVDIRPADVLLGRGRGIQDHPGNDRFRSILEDYRDVYNTARRYQKRRVTMELRQMLMADGVRFLKQVDTTKWVESDTKAVEEKIAQHFRTSHHLNCNVMPPEVENWRTLDPLDDPKMAVRQMMNFLHFKATYFGEDKVTREIELSDLTENDDTLLRSGVFLIPKHRDRAGRLILYTFSHLLHGCTVETVIRVIFFLFYNLLASLPEVQMKGVATVYYDSSKPGTKFINPGFQAQLRTMAVANSIPFRFTSLHLCMKPTNGNSVLNKAVIRVFLNTHRESTLVRTRLHIGSDMEIQYNLQSHGISLEACPVDSSGEIHKARLNTWYESHLQYMKSRGLCVDHLVPSKAAANIVSTIIESGEIFNSYTTLDIRATDVLLGRGRGFQDHPGNVRFRSVLEEYRGVYDTARKHQKRRITVELRQMLTGEGVRFLKQVDGTKWVESDSKAVEDKIGQLFRTARKKKEAVMGRSFPINS